MISCYGARELPCKLLRGGGGAWGGRGFYIIHYLLLHERQMNIYLFHMTRSWHVVLVTGKKSYFVS